MTNKTYGLKWAPMDKGDQYILNESSYACLFTPEQLPKSLRDEDVWLDIGAHMGSFSLRISPWVKRVIAVEPSAINLDHLVQNILLNDIENVTVVRAAAIGGASGPVNLGLGKTFNYTNRVGFIRGRQNVTVPGININSLIDMYGVNKIKMDCEGSEEEIIRAANFLTIDEIIFEWHFTLIPDPDWTKLRTALEILYDAGFEILRAPVGEPTKRWTAIIWCRKEITK